MKNQPVELKESKSVCPGNAAALVLDALPDVVLLAEAPPSAVAFNQSATEAVWPIKRALLTHGIPALLLVSPKDRLPLGAVAGNMPADAVRILERVYPSNAEETHETGFFPASSAAIAIPQEENGITPAVKDDGVGFLFAPAKNGAGLKNIINRMYSSNGRFTTESRPGERHILKIKFPVYEPINT